MTTDDVIRMAREAGFATSWTEAAGEALERFATLVADAEREACVECIKLHVPRSGRDTPEYKQATKMIDRICARGKDKGTKNV